MCLDLKDRQQKSTVTDKKSPTPPLTWEEACECNVVLLLAHWWLEVALADEGSYQSGAVHSLIECLLPDVACGIDNKENDSDQLAL